MALRCGDETLFDVTQSSPKKTKFEAKGKGSAELFSVDAEAKSEGGAEAVAADYEAKSEGGAEAVAADYEAEVGCPHICNNWENCVMECDDPEKDRQMRLYTRQYHESGGFDITDFPTFGFMGKLIPVDLLNDSYSTPICTKALELAIDSHNKNKNTDLELVDIVKSNMNPFRRFFTTFVAKSKSKEEEDAKTYQASMFYNKLNKRFIPYIFREKVANAAP